jgi:hypothetical protein
VIARVILHETHVLRQERLLVVLACLNWLQGASSMYRSGWCGLKSFRGSLVSWGAPFDMKVLLDERALHEQPAWMGSLSLDKGRYLGGGGEGLKEVLSIQFCWLLHKTSVLLYAGQANLTRLGHGIEVESLFSFSYQKLWRGIGFFWRVEVKRGLRVDMECTSWFWSCNFVTWCATHGLQNHVMRNWSTWALLKNSSWYVFKVITASDPWT